MTSLHVITVEWRHKNISIIISISINKTTNTTHCFRENDSVFRNEVRTNSGTRWRHQHAHHRQQQQASAAWHCNDLINSEWFRALVVLAERSAVEWLIAAKNDDGERPLHLTLPTSTQNAARPTCWAIIRWRDTVRASKHTVWQARNPIPS